MAARFRAIPDEHNRVGYAGIQRMDDELRGPRAQGLVEREGVRFAHLDLHVVANHLRPNQSGHRLEGNIASFPGDLLRKPRKAARAVATHLGLATVVVVVTHPKIRVRLRGLDDEQTVRANATMAVAKPGNSGGVERERAIAIVEQDEIVSGPVHFGKIQHRGGNVSR